MPGKIQVIRVGKIDFLALRRRGDQPGHTLRLPGRPGSQQGRLRHREDRRVRPDSERKSEDCDGGIAGILAEDSQAKSNVLPERLQPGQRAALAICLPGLLHAAQANERLPPRFFGTQARADAVLGV